MIFRFSTFFSFALGGLALLIPGCSSSAPKAANAKDMTWASDPNRLRETQKPLQESGKELTITYRNGSSLVTFKYDPSDEDLFVNMSGTARPVPENLDTGLFVDAAKPKAKPVDVKDSAWGVDQDAVTAEVMGELQRAQELFYKKEYDRAQKMVRSSLEKRMTAEGLALLGSIMLMEGEKTKAKEYYLQALKINPNMSDIPEILKKLE